MNNLQRFILPRQGIFFCKIKTTEGVVVERIVIQ